MADKREYGQYYTIENPFSFTLFREWIDKIDNKSIVLEPFAVANNIPKLLFDAGYDLQWKCFDIEPPKYNAYPEYDVEERDTIADFPNDYKICITNCPYLGKSSARRRKINYPWLEDDLYKVCLNRMLNSCEYVAVIIPESFITAGIHKDRLYGVISLTCKMFSDTECPVCLALFTPKKEGQIKVYANEEYLGTLEELEAMDFKDTNYNKWTFNDPLGIIGVKTVDNRITNDCKFFLGDNIKPEDIKISSRAFTRISGLPLGIDLDYFLDTCNKILDTYRAQTKDVLLTSFKGLRKDGKYRRRLEFKTVRCILNEALKEIKEKRK